MSPETEAKIISEARLIANRANAAKSTGPKSEDGKNASKMNALRHGLTGCVSIMPGEDRLAHDAFFAEMTEAWQAEGVMERELALAIVEDAWRLKRGRAVDQNIFSLAHPDMSGEPAGDFHPEIITAASQARAFLNDAKQLQLLTLYQQRIHRTMEKNIERLEHLQTERKAARDKAFEEAQRLARLAHIEGQVYDPDEDFPLENGFVFSKAEIMSAIHRSDRLKAAAEYEKRGWKPEKGVTTMPKAA